MDGTSKPRLSVSTEEGREKGFSEGGGTADCQHSLREVVIEGDILYFTLHLIS